MTGFFPSSPCLPRRRSILNPQFSIPVVRLPFSVLAQEPGCLTPAPRGWSLEPTEDAEKTRDNCSTLNSRLAFPCGLRELCVRLVYSVFAQEPGCLTPARFKHVQRPTLNVQGEPSRLCVRLVSKFRPKSNVQCPTGKISGALVHMCTRALLFRFSLRALRESPERAPFAPSALKLLFKSR